jgi:mannose-1-phosphate guanylyltransferase
MYSVVMAGGSGTRFWPYSREHRPKQFLDITGNKPMIVETCERLRPVSSEDEIIIVLGKSHLKEAQRLFENSNIHILAEPVGRNTAPCIGLGALYARYSGCNGPIAFLPADHFIGNVPSFLKALETAAKEAEPGGIVTLGIVPSRPETGYGYIRRSNTGAGKPDNKVYPVSAFVEKPDLETALKYIQAGDYYWNAGIFVATEETILKEIEKYLPLLYEGLLEIEESLGKDTFENRLKRVYERLESISFDYGIMEKTKTDIYVLPCECGWSDVGSWSSLYDLKSKDHDDKGNLFDDDTILVDCENSYISGKSERLVACLGLKDCVIVDTNDALLVADINRSQDIRRIVEELKKIKREDLL